MKNSLLSAAFAALTLFSFIQTASAQKDNFPMVGGSAMYPTKDIVDNAVNSKDHTTLVAAIKAASLVETLKSAGPFTVFAPTNAAFDKVDQTALGNLLKPENKASLVKVLTYHVVAGRVSAEELIKMIKKGKGTAILTTVAGGKLKAMLKEGKVVLQDENGGTSTVTQTNIFQKNGVIHVVDTVVMPS